MLEKIIQSPLARFEVDAGDVLHGIKIDDTGYNRFGEVYFSFVKKNAVKAWKLHRKMTLNLIVPIGNVRFVFINPTYPEQNRIIEIGEKNYSRITVPPNIWFGFQGISDGHNMVVNVADIKHNPTESEKRQMDYFNYKWTTE